MTRILPLRLTLFLEMLRSLISPLRPDPRKRRRYDLYIIDVMLKPEEAKELSTRQKQFLNGIPLKHENNFGKIVLQHRLPNTVLILKNTDR